MAEYFKKISLSLNIKDDDIKKAVKKIDDTVDKETKKNGLDIKSLSKAFTTGVFARFLKSLKDLFSDAITRLNEESKHMFLTDAEVRDRKMTYGLSSSESYGISQAEDITGVSFEDMLMYGDSTQKELFVEAARKTSQFYEETMSADFIKKQLEYQTEMKLLRIEMEHELIGFFMEHKDEIVKVMELGMTFMGFSMDALSWIVDLLGNNERSDYARTRETQSILNSYTSNNRSNSVSFVNNFNAANGDTSQFANMSNIIYKQTIDALNRG